MSQTHTPLRSVISWSSGKDAALTLLRLRDDPRYEVVGLYTTHVADGVPYQNTPLQVVRQQAHQPPNPVYQQCVADGLRHSGLAIDAVAFGDMFHNGIADYRRSYIEPAGWQCVFPLLGDNPADLAREILQRGITTHLITVDTSQCDGRFCGRLFDAGLLAELPPDVDPCGENGEFHTLVTDMPGFNSPLTLLPGEIDRSGRFHVLSYQVAG